MSTGIVEQSVKLNIECKGAIDCQVEKFDYRWSGVLLRSPVISGVRIQTPNQQRQTLGMSFELVQLGKCNERNRIFNFSAKGAMGRA